MPTVLTKEEIFSEIRQTIKHLMRERDRGRESFEIADFFKSELEAEILTNFENKITTEEYEQVVSEIFGAVPSKKSSIPKGKIQSETEKLIKQYRMKSKKQIIQKLIDSFEPSPDEIPFIKDVVVEKYNRLMRDPLEKKIAALVKSGTTEMRLVMSLLRREGYDIDQGIVEEILLKILKEQDSARQKYSRGRRGSLKVPLAQSDSPVKGRLKEQMRKSLLQKARYNRQRFIRKECPSFKFTQQENTTDGDMRVLVYFGNKNGMTVSIKTLLSNDRVTDVQIAIAKENLKRSALLNVAELHRQASVEDDDGTFLQSWLKKANQYSKFGNLQEIIWFLSSVLNDRFGLPAGLAKYLKPRLVDHLTEFDKTLTKYVIDKAVANV